MYAITICKDGEHKFERIIDNLYQCVKCGTTKVLN